MPSPVGHALAGALVYEWVVARAGVRPARAGLLLCIGCAVAPDLDLLLNVALGGSFHRGPSHSVGAAMIVALLAFAWQRLRGRPAGIWPALLGLGWLSHVVLDTLGRDTNPPIGLQALWPFAFGWYASPWPLFLDIGRTLELQTIGHNALAAVWECVMLAPILLIAVRRARTREAHNRGARL